MPNIKHILFPIDFSERCCGAVPFVESMANHYDARITLFTAMQPMYYAAMGDLFLPEVVNLEGFIWISKKAPQLPLKKILRAFASSGSSNSAIQPERSQTLHIHTVSI